jgi:hypothetical protein
MLLSYMAILLVDAVAIVGCFLGVAVGWLTLDRKYLASWAGGTTGLGAGSLLFKLVLDYLFGIGGGTATHSERHDPKSGSWIIAVRAESADQWGMDTSLPTLSPHPAGEQPSVEEWSTTADTLAEDIRF